MSLTAYIRVRGSYIEEPVVYDLGPVWVDKIHIDGFYSKTGFTPQPTAVTGTVDDLIVGSGADAPATASAAYGPFVRYSTVSANTLAVPDEMLPSQTLRDRQYTMSYLTFYGAAAAGIAAVRSSNTFTVPTGHNLYNGQLVTLTTTNTLPGGSETDTLYYIVARTTTSVSIALTPGGSVITLSSAGTGTHKIVPFTEVGSFAKNLNPRMSNQPGKLIS